MKSGLSGPYKCKICEKTFYASGHYVDHMKIHIGIKNYECQECKKSFIHLSSFQKHKRVHSGEKVKHQITGSPFPTHY